MEETINSVVSSHVAQLTEAPADVDVEVNAVVTVVHQEAVAHFDQWAEVVLLAVRVKHVTWHLDTAFIHLLIRVSWFLTREYLTSICQLWGELLFWPWSERGDKINWTKWCLCTQESWTFHSCFHNVRALPSHRVLSHSRLINPLVTWPLTYLLLWLELIVLAGSVGPPLKVMHALRHSDKLWCPLKQRKKRFKSSTTKRADR